MPETEQNQVIDLDFNMEDVDLSRPVLKDGTYDATIAFKRPDVAKNSGKQMLVIGYRLAQVAENTKGEIVNPGFTLVQRVMAEPTGNLTQKMVNERLGAIHFAATGEKTGKPDAEKWLGKEVKIRVKVREPKGEYSESNEISGVYPKK